MNSDNGALEFDTYFNNEKLIGSINEAEKRVKGFSTATVKEGEKIDDVFKITAENIKIQKDVIAKLEQDLNSLNIQISKLDPGTAQKELKKDAAQVSAELKAEKYALKQLEAELEATEVKTKSFRTQVREAREELIRMERAGLRGTPAYTELQQKLGELTDAMGDAQAQANVLANDERGFRGVVSMVGGLTGAMSAAQGAVGLFSGENENLNRIMLKVQSMMAITIGLQQVAEMLNKDSYFSIVVLTKAKEMLAIAETKVATAMGVSTVAARVLMATLTLGLSVAITAVIVLISKMSSESAEAKKKMEELNKSIAENAYKPISALEELSVAWSRLGSDMVAKNKFIDDNAEKFEELGVKVNNVKDAEELLVKNKDKFIESLVLRAKAMAATEMAAEKYKEALLKQLELENEPEKAFVSVSGGQFGGSKLVEVDNSKYVELKKQKEKLEKEGLDLFKQAAEFSEKEKEIIRGIGLSAEKITNESLKGIDATIEKLNERYAKAVTESDRKQLSKQIEEMEKLRAKMDVYQSDKDAAKDSDSKKKEAFKKEIENYKENVKAELDAAENVLQLLDIVQKKRAEIAGDNSALGKGKKEILDNFSSDVNSKVKEETSKLLDEYSGYLERKRKLQEDYVNDMILLQKKLDLATADEERAGIKTAMTNRTTRFNQDNKGSGDAEYDKLLLQYRNFEQQKAAISQEYDEKRRKALEFGNQKLVDELNKAEVKALSEISLSQLQDSPAFKELFDNLDRMTVDKMIEIRNQLETEWAKMDLSPEDLDALRSKLDEVTKEIQTRNPFKALSDAIKRYKEDKSSANFKEVMQAVSASISAVKDVFDQVLGSLDKLGVKTDEGTKQVLSDISGMMQGASDLAMGIATGNPMQIVQGTIAVISNGIDLIFGGKDRKLQKSIEQHAKEVENLKDKYEELERAIDRALGSDRYSQQKALINNLKQQQREYSAMIAAERDKKKTDSGKIKEYQDAIKSNSYAIEDAINGMREDILTSSVSSVAGDLGNAIIDAFAAGENAAVAWGEKVDDIVGNVVRKMLVQKLIEQPVGQIINRYMSQWVDSSGNFLGFDSVMSSAQNMGKELAALGPGLSSLMENLPADIKKYLTGDDSENKSSLSGAIKGVSEETASIISGQMNAMRINQIESLEIFRQQLFHLAEIASNTRYNKYLQSIDSRLSSMSSDQIRSKGLN